MKPEPTAPPQEVMACLREVYNGDIGYVGDVDPEAGEVTVAFDGAGGPAH